jgi:hypothetical protein
MTGGITMTLPTDIPLISLGSYAVKLTDVLFIIGGLAVLILWGGYMGAFMGVALILAGILGVAVGWD